MELECVHTESLLNYCDLFAWSYEITVVISMLHEIKLVKLETHFSLS